MIHEIIQWVVVIIVTEALVEIVVDSKIMMPLRNWIVKKEPDFFGELIKCGYCFSVWMAIPGAFILPGDIFGNWYFDLFIKWILLHRTSNIFHGIISKIFNRQPYHVVHQKLDVPINNVVEVPDDDQAFLERLGNKDEPHGEIG
jgi:hypothetical protein